MRHLFTLDFHDYDPDAPVYTRPSVRALIIRDGRIAMMHSLKFNYYKFPGGGMEPGETQVDTLIRETMEEAGLAVIRESVTEYGHVLRIQKSKEGGIFHQDNYYYLCRAEEEIHPQTLDDYEADERFTLEFINPMDAIATNRFAFHGPGKGGIQERECLVLEQLMEEKLL